MSAAQIAPTVSPVTEAEGAQIRARRTRIGMGVKPLADRAGIDRGTLKAIEEGAPARDSTIGAIERALDELEEAMGLGEGYPSTEAGLIEFDVNVDAIGVHVVVKGPVADAAEIEASVARLIRDIGKADKNARDL